MALELMAFEGCSVPLAVTRVDRMLLAATLTKVFGFPILSFPAPSIRSGGPGKEVSCVLLRHQMLLCLGKNLGLFPKMTVHALCLLGHSTKSKAVGPSQKSEGILPLHIKVWGLRVMKLQMTKLISWDIAFPWVNMLPRVCFIHALN